MISHFLRYISFYNISLLWYFTFYDILLFMFFYFYDISLLWYLYFYDISLSCNFHPWLIPNIRCFDHSAPHFLPGVADNKENIEVRGPQYITDVIRCSVKSVKLRYFGNYNYKENIEVSGGQYIRCNVWNWDILEIEPTLTVEDNKEDIEVRCGQYQM